MKLRSVAPLAGCAVLVSFAAVLGCTHTIVEEQEAADGGPTSSAKRRDGGAPAPGSSDGGSSSSSGGSSSGGSSSSSGGSSGSSGGSSSGGSSSSSGNAPVCPGPTPADPPWNPPPPVTTTACTSADVTFFDQQAQIPNQTFAALETAMKGRSATCAACIFGHDTDPAWRPIVYVGAGGGAFFNYGACFARAPGGSDACGAALERTELCLDAVCSVDDCGSDAAAKTCAQGAAANPASCGKYDPPNACGGAANLQALDAKCATALDVIKVMCGGA